MSDQITRWLDESQRLADKATAGPWEYMTNETPDGENLYFTIEDSEQGSVAETNGSYQGRADAEFIAHARSMLPAAVEALRAVLRLHRPVTFYDDETEMPLYWACAHCLDEDGEQSDWPCETLHAVADALGLEGDQS